MPKYTYSCPMHGRFQTVKPMARCSEPEPCPTCKTCSERIFTADFQLTTQPTWLAEENRYWLGTSETERLERMRQDDKDYEKAQRPVGQGATKARDL